MTSNLIRELVNAKLVERGLESHRQQHARLGLPLYDVEQILTVKNKENSNMPHSPEGTNLTLAESINKQFALARVFDPGHRRRPHAGATSTCTTWASSPGPTARASRWSTSRSSG